MSTPKKPSLPEANADALALIKQVERINSAGHSDEERDQDDDESDEQLATSKPRGKTGMFRSHRRAAKRKSSSRSRSVAFVGKSMRASTDEGEP